MRHPGSAASIKFRISQRFDPAARAVFGPLTPWLRGQRWQWLRHLPDLQRHRGYPPPWRSPSHDTPEQLRTVPGVWRDREAEERAYEAGPIYSFHALYYKEMTRVIWRWGWHFVIPTLPRIHRMALSMRQVIAGQPLTAPPALDPQSLTDELRREADRLGLNQIGFAPYDPKYTFAEAAKNPPDQGSVIVCIQEQDWKRTQLIPSAKSEREVVRAYEGVVERAAALARFLQDRGFRADVHGPAGMAVSIHYGVDAGLGQLGLNGQLLTPQAGSRCRITLITTNATLIHGAPVDYGMHAICDECQLCVRRCPSGAIPKTRSYHRGIMKARIKPDRCFPIMAQAHGCAICMKVCPIQRYGLDAVKEHLVETGNILGKGTSELEGFHWTDGRFYGPGEKPRMTTELLHPLGVELDLDRNAPVDVTRGG